MALWRNKMVIISFGIVLSHFSVVGCTETDSSLNERNNLLRIESIIQSKGAAAGFDQYMKLSNETGNGDKQPGTQSLELAFKLKHAGLVNAAVAVLVLNTETNPESKEAWFHLGQGYTQLADEVKARQSFNKALKIDPEYSPAKSELGWLEYRIADAAAETRESFIYFNEKNTGLKGPYLGQKPPGRIPEKFAPGILSSYGTIELACTISGDGKEIYFQRSGSGIMATRLADEGWTVPKTTNIDGSEMFIWPQDGRIYLNVRLPQPDGGTKSGIGVIGKTADGWSEPTFLVRGMFVTLSDHGYLYTTNFGPEGGIIRHLLDDGVCGEGEVIGAVTDPSYFDAHPCIAPDESYMIFDSGRPENNTLVDLYISFQNDDGSWTDAKNLGPQINMSGINQCPILSPDGKYLFWNCHNDIYWVSTDFFAELKAAVLK
ncbi:MAG: hypothetical protein GY780_02960 [bacterium]|nr:hypothetical protein [bacterium]